MKAHPVAVIGASNVDISATSLSPLVSGDSNPGKVEISFGGVGRNIAENLCRLGQSVSLITAYGEDPFGQMLRAQAQELGLDVSLSLRDERMSSSLYVCVNQPEGEMAVAVSDMEVCGGLSPDFFRISSCTWRPRKPLWRIPTCRRKRWLFWGAIARPLCLWTPYPFPRPGS